MSPEKQLTNSGICLEQVGASLLNDFGPGILEKRIPESIKKKSDPPKDPGEAVPKTVSNDPLRDAYKLAKERFETRSAARDHIEKSPLTPDEHAFIYERMRGGGEFATRAVYGVAVTEEEIE